MALAWQTLMRLLYLLPEYFENASGGIGTYYRHLLPMIAAMGHEVRVIVGSGFTAESAPTPCTMSGVSIQILDRDRLFKYHEKFTKYASMPTLRRHLAAAWAMWEMANHGDGFDLIEATDWGLLFVPGIVDGGPPCVVQLHGSIGQVDHHDPTRGAEAQGQLIRLIERTAIAQAATVQAYSAANSNFWAAQTRRSVSPIFPAWTSSAHVSESKPRSTRGLVVGRIQRWKGPQILCEALSLMQDRAPQIDWIGADMPFDERTSMSTHLHAQWPSVWGEKVVVHPQVPPAQATQAQTEASFAVIPSLWDTFNFTCVETMGAGTPVICSTGAGASELISNGVNGLTFENGNAKSLADALQHMILLEDHSRRGMGIAGRESIVSRLDPVAISERRIAEYQNVEAQSALPTDDWLRSACCPETHPFSSIAFLEQFPMKLLLAHVTDRLIRKVRQYRS